MNKGLIEAIIILPGTVVVFIPAALLLLVRGAGWAVVFLVGNLIYMPAVEEKGLLARFGGAYQEYRKQVPPWIPRPMKWDH